MKEVKWMTSEEFANKVQFSRLKKENCDRGVLINEVAGEIYPGLSYTEVMVGLSEFTINKKLDRQDEKFNRNVYEWKHTGQLSLFNQPGYKSPEWMWINGKKKHQKDVTLAEAREWMQAEIDHLEEKTELLSEAWNEAKNSKSMAVEQLVLINKACEAAIAAGYDPEEVTNGQALKINVSEKAGIETISGTAARV